MKIIITGEEKEIAALVEALQGRRCRDMSPDEFNKMLETALAQALPRVILPEE